MISKYKYIRRMITVYLCVLIPIIAFSLLTAQLSFRQAKQREERIMTQILQDTTEELEKWYSNFEIEAMAMKQRTDLSPSIVQKSRVEELKAVQLLKFVNLFSTGTNVVICYGDNSVYTLHGKTSVPVYFNNTLMCTEKSSEEAKKTLEKDRTFITLLQTKGGGRDLLLYHYPIQYTRNYRTSVQFIVSLDQIINILETSDSQFILCMKINDKEVYFQLKDRKCTILDSKSFAAVKQKQSHSLNTVLETSGMELELYFNPAESWTEFRHFQIIYLCLMIGGITLSILISFGLSGHRWRRFLNLTSGFAMELQHETIEFKDEFDYIRIMLEQSLQNCECAEQKVQTYRCAMMQQAATMIFCGTCTDSDYIEKTLHSYGVQSTKNYYYLCGIVLKDSNVDRMKVENLLSGYFYCESVLNDQRVLFLLADSEIQDQTVEKRLEMVNLLCRQMLISKLTVCRVVLSQMYNEISKISNAYQEIVSLLENPLLPDEFIECWDQRVSSGRLTNAQSVQLDKFIYLLEKRDIYEAENVLRNMIENAELQDKVKEYEFDAGSSMDIHLKSSEAEHRIAENFEGLIYGSESATDHSCYLKYCVRQALVQAVRRDNSEDNRLLEEILSVNPISEKFEEKIIEILRKYYVNDKEDEQLNEIMKYIQNNYGRCDLSKEEVSEKVGINKTQMSKLFKEKIGIGYLDYLTKLRMDKAEYLLLHTDQSVKNILQEIGYIDQTNFTKKFKAYYGMSPTEFRCQKKLESTMKRDDK